MRRDVRAALALAGCVSLAALLTYGMHALTRPAIAAQQRSAQRAELSVLLPASLRDNEPLDDTIAIRAPHWLGSAQPLRAWRAHRDEHPAALVLEAVAPDGYGGPIHLRVGVDAQGRVLGVVIDSHRETPGFAAGIDSHRETPGLGAGIASHPETPGFASGFDSHPQTPGFGADITAHREASGLAIDDSDGLAALAGRSLSNPPRDRWALRRDGGDFDHVTGATVTPRAVLRAVRRVLDYVERHGAELYAAPAGSLMEHTDAPER